MADSPSRNDDALLSVRSVTLQYRSDNHLVTATYRVSFDVLQSDRFVVLGPSGCGKSTLLKAIGGYLQPTASSTNPALPAAPSGVGGLSGS